MHLRLHSHADVLPAPLNRTEFEVCLVHTVSVNEKKKPLESISKSKYAVSTQTAAPMTPSVQPETAKLNQRHPRTGAGSETETNGATPVSSNGTKNTTNEMSHLTEFNHTKILSASVLSNNFLVIAGVVGVVVTVCLIACLISGYLSGRPRPTRLRRQTDDIDDSAGAAVSLIEPPPCPFATEGMEERTGKEKQDSGVNTDTDTPSCGVGTSIPPTPASVDGQPSPDSLRVSPDNSVCNDPELTYGLFSLSDTRSPPGVTQSV